MANGAKPSDAEHPEEDTERIMLDWTPEFPVLVNNGNYGFEVIMMWTEEMLERSTYFAHKYANYDPPKGVEIHGIEAPDCELAIFNVYRQFVARGTATLDTGKFTVQVWKASEIEEELEEREGVIEDLVVEEESSDDESKSSDGEQGQGGHGVQQEGGQHGEGSEDGRGEGTDAENEDYSEEALNRPDPINDDSLDIGKEEGFYEKGPSTEPEDSPEDRKVNETILIYIKTYCLAEELGDCKAANQIISALIDYTIEHEVVFNDYQVQQMDELQPEFDGEGKRVREPYEQSSMLWKLAVDLWCFALKPESLTARKDFGCLSRHFLMDADIVRRRAQVEFAGKTVEEGFDSTFIGEGRERYYIYNRLYPQPQL